MDKIFIHPTVSPDIRAISSKSEAHRALICAALSDGECNLVCTDTNADIDATVACLNSLGADIKRTDNGFFVKPISKVLNGGTLECNESGSTFRFLLPLAAALGADCAFNMRGRLASRPLSPLYELLESRGITLSPKGSNPLKIKGKLTHGRYSVAADVSSQFVSGMLFALSVTEGESTLTLEGKIESAPYIMMTLDALKLFGADVDFDGDRCFTINGKARLTSPRAVTVGGDWSNAAFVILSGAIGKNPVTLSGLDLNSHQGDKEILDILCKMDAKIEKTADGITVFPSKLKGIEIDAANIPDLVPVLAVAAAIAEGETKIFGAERLRFKESDRIESICALLSSLGAIVSATDDGMMIYGKSRLFGGEVDSFNDHRIAMSAAIASLVCDGAVKIKGFEAINKSYPTFGENFS